MATDAPTEPRTTRLGWELLGIAALALTLNLAGNGSYPLFDRDEPRYAGCTREMMASGDWIHPTFNAEPRYLKPVLIYWLMAGGMTLGGDNPFGARLVSALAGMGTCLLVYGLGRRMFGPRVGFWSAIMLATTPLFVFESKMATTDATLTLFLVAAWWCLWELGRGNSRRVAAGFWVAMALAVLTKGPIGPALVGAAVIAGWALGAPVSMFKWDRLRWGWGVPLFLAIAAPWYVAIMVVSQGAYYDVAIGYHVIRRATEGLETHGGFPGYYVVLTMALAFPWSAWLVPAVGMAWRSRKGDPRLGFLLGWVLGPLVLLEVVRTKLIHYYLPALPACALLCGWLAVSLGESLLSPTSGDRRSAWDWTFGRRWMRGFGLAFGAGALASAWFLPEPLAIPAIVLGLVVGGGMFWASQPLGTGWSRPLVAAGRSALVWAVALVVVTGWFLPLSTPYLISHRVGVRLTDLAERHQAVAAMSGNFQPPNVVYSHGRPLPVTRTRSDLVDLAQRRGPLVLALTGKELEWLKGEGALEVQVVDVLNGFNVERFREETLSLSVIRPRQSGLAVDGRPRPPLR